jgi:YfiR/HmsC-like
MGDLPVRRRSRVLLRVAAVLVVAVSPGRAAAEPTEPEVKVEFVERFIRFVDWDEKSLGSDFVTCVVGDSPMTPYFQRLAKARKLKDRHAVVNLVAGDHLDKLAGCHAVFIGAVDKKQLGAVLGRTAGHPVLTISDSPGAAQAGVIINFYEEDDHVRYEINVRAAEDSGLVLRAKLLHLARIVGERERRGG